MEETSNYFIIYLNLYLWISNSYNLQKYIGHENTKILSS